MTRRHPRSPPLATGRPAAPKQKGTPEGALCYGYAEARISAIYENLQGVVVVVLWPQGVGAGPVAGMDEPGRDRAAQPIRGKAFNVGGLAAGLVTEVDAVPLAGAGKQQPRYPRTAGTWCGSNRNRSTPSAPSKAQPVRVYPLCCCRPKSPENQPRSARLRPRGLTNRASKDPRNVQPGRLTQTVQHLSQLFF
ncbi:hypothetical protein LY04_00762 [Oceanimonas baumannii]|uniref:CheW-like domain-containing protein n=1 Tax=Oceanimonas baumannii TaxID=129578 RepID=A0ABY2F1V0_9GAMM|nr:hypothetical protein LY04_00762 [Oceanimonas baumannii]